MTQQMFSLSFEQNTGLTCILVSTLENIKQNLESVTLLVNRFFSLAFLFPIIFSKSLL